MGTSMEMVSPQTIALRAFIPQLLVTTCLLLAIGSTVLAADQEITRIEPAERLPVRANSWLSLSDKADHLIYDLNGKTVLYNLKTRRPRFEIPTNGDGNFDFTRDLKYAAAVSRRGVEVAEIRKRAWKPFDLVNCRGIDVAFSPDGKLIAAVISNQDLASRVELVVWDMKTREVQYREPLANNARLIKLGFSTDSTHILVLVDLHTYGAPNELTRVVLKPGTQQVVPVSDCRDFICLPGKTIYFTGKSIMGYSSTPHEQLWNISSPYDRKRFQVVEVDGVHQLLLGHNKSVELWIVNTSDGTKRNLEAHEVSVDAATISHDGKWLITAGSDHRVRLWDFQTLEPLAWFRPGDVLVEQLLFTAEDAQLMMRRGNQIEFWKTAELLALNTKP